LPGGSPPLGGSMLAKLVQIISLNVRDRPDLLRSFTYSIKRTSLGWKCLVGGLVLVGGLELVGGLALVGGLVLVGGLGSPGP